MSKAMQQSRFKTTFYIDEENKKRMDSFVSSRKKTEFINQALARSLEEIEQELALATLRTKIHAIKRVKSNTSIADTLDEVRAESLKY